MRNDRNALDRYDTECRRDGTPKWAIFSLCCICAALGILALLWQPRIDQNRQRIADLERVVFALDEVTTETIAAVEDNRAYIQLNDSKIHALAQQVPPDYGTREVLEVYDDGMESSGSMSAVKPMEVPE